MQRCNEPDEIKSHIASSALRTPNYFFDDKNVFAIYVSYYVKVKLTLSGMGGELSLKLPFTLAHFDDSGSGGGSGVNQETSSSLVLHQQESIATDEDTNDNACDTAGKAINATTNTTNTNKPMTIMAAVESHQQMSNNNANLINYHNSHASCSSSSSSGMPPLPPSPLTKVSTNKGQVSRDLDDDFRDDHDMIAPSISSLRQRRFSQVRQERIRPEDNSLDRIETLSDDGDVDLEGHEMVLVEDDGEDDNGNSRLVDKETAVGVQRPPKPERKLTGSSTSMDETELLDEVFCDTLVIGQQHLSMSGTGGQQGSGQRVSQLSTKTSSSMSTSSSSSVVRGNSGPTATGCAIGNEQQQSQEQLPPQQGCTNATQVTSAGNGSGQRNMEASPSSSTNTTLVQVHAPQSSSSFSS